ncbi:CoA transferase [Diaminobutyricimonas sp. LJ205]|uniref:CoA transferase n=1 Tax=Diaminobutyricimonas sp. LJ205 TaxID=2683590 RepID=UPI0012F51F6D|nr:CoA transferase [Diaminobutyricimonas sp. LJ205]
MASLTPPAKPLTGLRVIEHASFVAGPSAGVTLAQLGADVIRVDPLGGAPDYSRWPVSQRSGHSLFWSSFNRGKRSIALNTRCAEGRELLIALATAPDDNAGILIDNTPNASWLDYKSLAARRPDVIKVHIQGHSDGRGAVDYTVNPEVGMPSITGPEDHVLPVNHALPAWDLLTGMTATSGLLAALRHRDHTGKGANIEIALADVALAGVANMGWLTEADELGHDRDRVGNYLYGSYGVDFGTSDGERLMVVALTGRQWDALCRVTGTEAIFAALGDALDVDWADEGARFSHREVITSILRPWFSVRTMDEVSAALTQGRALWSKYRTFTETLADFRKAPDSSVLVDIDQPGTGRVVSARSPLRAGSEYGDTHIAPSLAEHTEEVLEELLGLSSREISELSAAGVIGTTV